MRRGVFLSSVLLLLGVIGSTTPSLSATTVTITLTSYPEEIAITDVNNDGHRDIVAVADDPENSESWQIITVRGYGNGTFYPAQYKDLVIDDNTNELPAMGIGLASGDTIPDVFFLIKNPPFDKVYRLYGNGDGTFGSKSGWNVGHSDELCGWGVAVRCQGGRYEWR